MTGQARRGVSQYWHRHLRKTANHQNSPSASNHLAFLMAICLFAVAEAKADDKPKQSETPKETQIFGAPQVTDPARAGSVPNRYKGKDGFWSDLPRPDESWAHLPENKNRKAIWNLSQQEQDKILKARRPSASMMGSFYEMNNLLYCSGESFLMTTSEEVAKTQLHTVHWREYKPTAAEVFEAMARQTRSSIQYDPTFLSKWIAIPTAMALPYSIKLAEDWHPEDRGEYVSYIPKLQPVGLDIYMLGRYSGLSSEDTIKVRNDNALRFAHQFDKTLTADKMKDVRVDGCDAIYYETKSPMVPDRQWRQWSLVHNGEAFVIVSCISDENANVLVPQVQAMVSSFHATEPPPSSPGL